MASLESSFSNGCNIKSGILQGNNALFCYVYGSGSGFQFSRRSGRETWIYDPNRETMKKYQYNGLQNLLLRLSQQHEGTVEFQLSTYWSIDYRYILWNKLTFSFKKRIWFGQAFEYKSVNLWYPVPIHEDSDPHTMILKWRSEKGLRNTRYHY